MPRRRQAEGVHFMHVTSTLLAKNTTTAPGCFSAQGADLGGGREAGRLSIPPRPQAGALQAPGEVRVRPLRADDGSARGEERGARAGNGVREMTAGNAYVRLQDFWALRARQYCRLLLVRIHGKRNSAASKLKFPGGKRIRLS